MKKTTGILLGLFLAIAIIGSSILPVIQPVQAWARNTVRIWVQPVRIGSFYWSTSTRNQYMLEAKQGIEYYEWGNWGTFINFYVYRDYNQLQFSSLSQFQTWCSQYNDYEGDEDGNGESSWRHFFVVGYNSPGNLGMSWSNIAESYDGAGDNDDWCAYGIVMASGQFIPYNNFERWTVRHEVGHGMKLADAFGGHCYLGNICPWAHCVMKTGILLNQLRDPDLDHCLTTCYWCGIEVDGGNKWFYPFWNDDGPGEWV